MTILYNTFNQTIDIFTLNHQTMDFFLSLRPSVCPTGQAFCPTQGLCVSENRSLNFYCSMSSGLTYDLLRCSKSCCGGSRNTDGGVRVDYSCLQRAKLTSGEGDLDYSNATQDVERRMVPHANYTYLTPSTTLRFEKSIFLMIHQKC